MSGRFWLGAKLGAIRGGRRGSCVDPGGIGSLLLSHVWTDVDTYGHRLEIYEKVGGSSPSGRAAESLVLAGDFTCLVLVEGFPQGDPWEPFSSTDFVTQEIAIGVDPGQYGGDARFCSCGPL